ncbi:MAG: hypothetical protein EOM91_14405 [Sphingobacteriia bacterium]|nr:hypothetical protein [Sphingobacteriia bacterium]NCC40609.1 hypothetical protein [Gammaproteobacteria bacterium]
MATAAATCLLAPGGVMIFSNNRRRFQIDEEALADLVLTDLSAATPPTILRAIRESFTAGVFTAEPVRLVDSTAVRRPC